MAEGEFIDFKGKFSNRSSNLYHFTPIHRGVDIMPSSLLYHIHITIQYGYQYL
jgi:hypothetical protein